MNDRCLEIKPGGKILMWNWDPSVKAYSAKDVTGSESYYFMESCILADGVTLRDLFLILDKDLPFYERIIGNWVEDIVKEGLTEEPIKDSQIDMLEIYADIEIDEDNKISAFSFPGFHGYNTEEDMAYALAFSGANDLIDLPVKLRDKVIFFNNKNEITEYGGATFTLYQILFGIIWELSFHGGPSTRKAKFKEMQEMTKRE